MVLLRRRRKPFSHHDAVRRICRVGAMNAEPVLLAKCREARFCYARRCWSERDGSHACGALAVGRRRVRLQSKARCRVNAAVRYQQNAGPQINRPQMHLVKFLPTFDSIYRKAWHEISPAANQSPAVVCRSLFVPGDDPRLNVSATIRRTVSQIARK